MKAFDEHRRENLPEIAQHYGLVHQLDKLYEEGEEMLEALRSVIDNGPDEKRANHLIEEIGDVFHDGNVFIAAREPFAVVSVPASSVTPSFDPS